MHKTPKISDVMAIIKRRTLLFLLPFVLITGIGIAVARLLPPVYQSSGVIMIEAQQVPLDLIRTTVTGYAEERIQRITQQIMGRTTLLDLINRFGLFQEEGDTITEEAKLEKLRDSFHNKMISAEVPDERTGKVKTINVAFSVAADGETPQVAMQMANFFVAKYLEYNLKDRQDSVQLTSDIIQRQLENLEEQLTAQEQTIAAFKAEHPQTLPELFQVNMQTETTLRRSLSDMDNQISNLKDRKVYLEDQLLTIEPNPDQRRYSKVTILPIQDQQKYLSRQALGSDLEHLNQLERQEMMLSSKYADDYPDLKKIREEIAGYRKKVADNNQPEMVSEEITADAPAVHDVYPPPADGQPQVLTPEKTKHVIAGTENIKRVIAAEMQQLEEENPGILLRPSAQKNPAYFFLQTQIRATELEIEGLLKQRQERYLEWQNYVKRLEETPVTEKGYQELTRGYTFLKMRYEETMAKHLEAKHAETVEARPAGEKFTVIEPPLLPEEPYKPNRLAIALISVVLGLGAGVGLASLVEFTDTRIRTAEDVAVVTTLPIMGVISDAKKVSSSKYGKLHAKYV